MAGRRKKKKTKSKKKGRGIGRKILFLLLFLVCGGAVLWQRAELVTGVQVHFFGGEGVAQIGNLTDLDRTGTLFSPLAQITGIPDYKSRFRFPSRDSFFTCFRMTGFEDRLFVCTENELKEPEGIEDVIRKRSFTGRMEPLKKSGFQDTLIRGFSRAHGIRPAPDAILVSEGRARIPSLLETAGLTVCLLLCFFFLFGFIKAMRG